MPQKAHPDVAHDSILENLVFLGEIVGKKIFVKLDVSQPIKVGLDRVPWNNIAQKFETISGVYKKSTNKEINFEFLGFQL